MIKTILVDKDKDDIVSLENMLSLNFPDIYICGKAGTVPTASKIIDETDPDLLFISGDLPITNNVGQRDCFMGAKYQVILVTNRNSSVNDAKSCHACNYLNKPFQKDSLILVVSRVLNKIQEKQEIIRNKYLAEKYFRESGNEDSFGIPTLDGFEFVPIKDIVCCEGLQKCTRVITKDKTDIISSYNLGEFRKFLEPYGFFSPHKSYLINLKFIRLYHKEGTILMTNGLHIPVAKRKKREFLDHIKHI